MKTLLFITLLFCFNFLSGQTPTGYWYGTANVKLNNVYNNYLVELIIEQDHNNVNGYLNYFFKNTYRSMPVRGTYNSQTRLIYVANVPVSYYGSLYNKDVDCPMDLAATLMESRINSTLKGSFYSQSAYKYTCPEIAFTLKRESEQLNKDSLILAIRSMKETYQVWKPGEEDTLTAVKIVPRKVINYVVNNQYINREKIIADEIEVESDSLRVDFYDNGEVDGDSISVFLNDELIAFNRILSTRSVHFDFIFDTSRVYNELTMFADNLGKIPPNTALMIVSDGKKRYQIRLTSNLESSATVRIKKKDKAAKSK